MNNLLTYPAAYCLVGIGLALYQPIRADWWGLAVLGGLIALYGFLAKGDRDDGRLEVGDNCYFIGFVYTLSIITMSLIMDADELLEGTRTSLHPLLKTVGIALGTSVVGMLGRFMLVYGVRIGEDAFHDAVREAAVAAASLKGTVAELREAVADAAGAMDAQASASGAKLEQLVEVTRSHMEEAAEAAAGALQALGEQTAAGLREQAQTLATLAADTAEALGNLRQAARTSTEEMAQSLAATASALHGHARTVESAAHRAGDALTAGAREALDQVSSGLRDALQANTFADARRNMEAVVETHRQAVAALQRTLGESVDGLREATALATARAEEARRTLAAVNSDLDRAGLDAASASVAQWQGAVAALNSQLPAVAEGQAQAAAAAASYRHELESLREVLRDFPPVPAGLPPPTNGQPHRSLWQRLLSWLGFGAPS